MNKQKVRIPQVIIGILLLGFFVFAGYKCISMFLQEKNEKNQFQQLRDMILEERDDEKTEVAPISSKKKHHKLSDLEKALRSKHPNYNKLYKQNKDFVGWIKIKNTPINYPVMYHPGATEYYLHRSFYKDYSYSGVPFLGEGTTLDGNNILLYSHHMKNGTMFASLVNYQNRSFRKKHSVVIFDTLKERRVYQVVAAFPTKIVKNSQKQYYHFVGKMQDTELQEFENWIKRHDSSFMDNIHAEDEYITLSTCAYHAKNGRFVLIGKRIMP